MIKTALVFIKQQLDQQLVNRFSLDESIVILNHLLEPDGGVPQKNQNKMVITLINLDHETAKQYYGGQLRTPGGNITKVNPALHFNADLLFTANFDDYEEALKFLNATIGFFQANNSFNSKTTPDIPAPIKMLNFDIEKSTYAEIHNLWSAMGAKYQPSIIYKVRHLTIASDEVKAIVTSVTDLAVGVQP